MSHGVSISKGGREGAAVKSLQPGVLCREGCKSGLSRTHNGLPSVLSVGELASPQFLPLAPPSPLPTELGTLVPLLLVLFFLTAEVLAPDLSGSSLVI